MSGIFRLLKRKWYPPAEPTSSFAGKNIIVTGANTGLGFEAAVKFVTLGASKVIIGVRSLEKGQQAKRLIEERTRKYDVVEVWHLDLNSYDSIREFAERASLLLDHVDVAVLNAGVLMTKYEVSPYGWEETLQVNLLSTVLLSLLLLPKLRSSRRNGVIPVLEFVSSALYEKAKPSPENQHAPSLLESYNTPGGYKGGLLYGISKLFLMCAVLSIASMVISNDGKPDVVATSVSPGACKSDLGRGYNSLLARIGKALMSLLLLRSTEAGARSLVSGVSVGERAHGGYWQDDEFKPLAPILTGDNGRRLRERVWYEILDALRKDVPAVVGLVRCEHLEH